MLGTFLRHSVFRVTPYLCTNMRDFDKTCHKRAHCWS